MECAVHGVGGGARGAYGTSQIAGGEQSDSLPGAVSGPGTALHYNRYRYYEPKMGRYVSRDPIGMQGGMNVYSYASSTPAMRADPLGLWDAPFANMPGVHVPAGFQI
ncbi:RHS repeat-associated core domain-containing protein [Pseudomonas sp. SK]|nr:RHS repeat-associated core domain-containing protein [Pseudomonas sp. SK]